MCFLLCLVCEDSECGVPNTSRVVRLIFGACFEHRARPTQHNKHKHNPCCCSASGTVINNERKRRAHHKQPTTTSRIDRFERLDDLGRTYEAIKFRDRRSPFSSHHRRRCRRQKLTLRATHAKSRVKSRPSPKTRYTYISQRFATPRLADDDNTQPPPQHTHSVRSAHVLLICFSPATRQKPACKVSRFKVKTVSR